MKKIEVVGALTLYNELHLVVLETGEKSKKSMSVYREQVKAIMKKQTAEPLFMLRSE